EVTLGPPGEPAQQLGVRKASGRGAARARWDTPSGCTPQAVPEKDEADRQVDDAEAREHGSRGEHRGGWLATDHEIVVGVHRPGGWEDERGALHPVWLEIERPPATARRRHGENGDRADGQHGLPAPRHAGDDEPEGGAREDDPRGGEDERPGGPAERDTEGGASHREG